MFARASAQPAAKSLAGAQFSNRSTRAADTNATTSERVARYLAGKVRNALDMATGPLRHFSESPLLQAHTARVAAAFAALHLAVASTHGAPVIRWRANPESDRVSGYRVYGFYDPQQFPQAGGAPEFVRDFGNSTNNVLEGLKFGRYGFEVTAYRHETNVINLGGQSVTQVETVESLPSVRVFWHVEMQPLRRLRIRAAIIKHGLKGGEALARALEFRNDPWSIEKMLAAHGKQPANSVSFMLLPALQKPNETTRSGG